MEKTTENLIEEIRWAEAKRCRKTMQKLAERKKQEKAIRRKTWGFKLLGLALIALSLWLAFSGILIEPNGKFDGLYLIITIPIGLIMIVMVWSFIKDADQYLKYKKHEENEAACKDIAAVR